MNKSINQSIKTSFGPVMGKETRPIKPGQPGTVKVNEAG